MGGRTDGWLIGWGDRGRLVSTFSSFFFSSLHHWSGFSHLCEPMVFGFGFFFFFSYLGYGSSFRFFSLSFFLLTFLFSSFSHQGSVDIKVDARLFVVLVL